VTRAAATVPAAPSTPARNRLGTVADPFGRCLPFLLLHDLADRISAQSARANARWGWLRRPTEGRRLVWIYAGASREGVRLGAELLHAIHETRLDVALVLTFEAEYPDLLAGLPSSPRVGHGFGPADYVGSLNAAWRRLAPLGVIAAGALPRRNLARAFGAMRHSLLVAPPDTAGLTVERVYPRHGQTWPGSSCASAADLSVLLTQAQVEPSMTAAAAAGGSRRLWWWHGDDSEAALRFVAMFRGHLREDSLFLGGPAVGALPKTAQCVLPISRWDRGPIAPGTCVMIDDPKWIPAVAAASTAAHLATRDDDACWQALACGLSLSCAPSIGSPSPVATRVTERLEDETAVLGAWQTLADDAATLRARSDDARRAFWQERRLAERVVGELLERVFAWN